MPVRLKRVVPYVIGLAVVAAIVYAFLPGPVPADVAVVSRGELRVLVEEDGKTRIRERYVVSAPVSGQLLRIVLKAGDSVFAGKTVLAVLQPSDPSLLDARALAEAEARVRATEAAQKQARAKLETAKTQYELAQREHDRAKELLRKHGIPQQEYDAIAHRERMALHDWKAAQFALQVADFELEQARAALLHSQPRSDPDKPYNGGRFEIRAPVSGKVLRVFQESAAVVTPGHKLLELGDPLDLEIEIDVLSRDAVAIRPGNKVYLEHWGGDKPLEARVRLVEPAAFLKISALGVEEQRVWVIADFVDPPEKRLTLGDAFRVEARIITWEGTDVLKVPAGALFRKGEKWAVFALTNGRAHLRLVTVGKSNGLETEIIDGLSEGDQVVVHPSDRIHEGVRVVAR